MLLPKSDNHSIRWDESAHQSLFMIWSMLVFDLGKWQKGSKLEYHIAIRGWSTFLRACGGDLEMGKCNLCSPLFSSCPSDGTGRLGFTMFLPAIWDDIASSLQFPSGQNVALLALLGCNLVKIVRTVPVLEDGRTWMNLYYLIGRIIPGIIVIFDIISSLWIKNMVLFDHFGISVLHLFTTSHSGPISPGFWIQCLSEIPCCGSPVCWCSIIRYLLRQKCSIRVQINRYPLSHMCIGHANFLVHFCPVGAENFTKSSTLLTLAHCLGPDNQLVGIRVKVPMHYLSSPCQSYLIFIWCWGIWWAQERFW